MVCFYISVACIVSEWRLGTFGSSIEDGIFSSVQLPHMF
jgi:hypothetical protein